MKMTRKTIDLLYEYGKKVYNEELDISTAAEEVSGICLDVASSSAKHYISWYSKMLQGDFLTWNSNSTLLLVYAERIINEHGPIKGKLAIESAIKFALHANRQELIDELYKLSNKYDIAIEAERNSKGNVNHSDSDFHSESDQKTNGKSAENNQEAFKIWLSTQPDHQYAPYTIKRYITALERAEQWLNVSLNKSVFEISTLDSFKEYETTLKAFPNYKQINYDHGHGDLSAALSLYRKFLEEKASNAIAETEQKSKTWLLTWNPNNWDWEELNHAISDIHHGKRWQESWSCISTHVRAGDRIFLTRLGTADNGILASGYAAGDPYEEAHWDEEKAAAGKTTRYIDVDFDWIVDTARESVLSQKLLQERFSDQKWNPQGSGIEIHSEYVADLERLWEEIRLGGEKEMNPKDTIEHIKSYITSQGFSYEDGLIENFYLSLKSKPFVILAGTSGTGKTRLVKLFAKAVGATTENGHFKMVSVRPDWSDSTDLFGHVDLNGKFVPGAIIDFVKQAELDGSHPYFLCLDEMNLARVEYYLSDILSIIETRDLKNGHIVSDPLISNTYYGTDQAAAGKYGTVRLPENLYLIGTVNMDETTFPFSRKVLDRANTIEFSFVDLLPDFDGDATEPQEPLNLDNSFLKTEYLLLKQCSDEAETVNTYCSELQDINKILQKASAHVGYRVRDEIVFYLLNNRKYGLLSENEAMDNELMQKILPRIQGSSISVKNMLCDLFKHCAGDYDGYQTQNDDISSKMMKAAGAASVKYPRSAEKIAFMVRRFEEDGFTSYWL